MIADWRHAATVPRLAPVVGAAFGALGGAVYWIGTQVWPTSVAVVLSMLATELLGAGTTAGAGERTERADASALVFAVLIKYNALMALSAANLPFASPANLALGLIMIAGQASSRALAVSVPSSTLQPAARRPSHADLVIALSLGFAPAALIGIPGLVGLATAILVRIAFVAYLRRLRSAIFPAIHESTRILTELSFYLGALATWAYV